MAQAERSVSGEITAESLIEPGIVEQLVRAQRVPACVRSIGGLPTGLTKTMLIFIPPEGVDPQDTVCKGSVADRLEYFRSSPSALLESIGRPQTLVVDRALGEEILSRVEMALKIAQESSVATGQILG